MELTEIKKYCIKELEGIEKRNPLLDIFYILLKENGKSYMALRTAWLKTRSKQLNLFSEARNEKHEINLLYMRKALKGKS